MPVYLAYQIEPKEMTQDKLIHLIDNYYDFFGKKRDSSEYIAKRQEEIKRYRNASIEHIREKMSQIGESPFEIVAWFAEVYLVKNHPLLEITLRHNDNCGARAPGHFTGISISPHHSGSEGLVDMIEFKPEMDAYLRM